MGVVGRGIWRGVLWVWDGEWAWPEGSTEGLGTVAKALASLEKVLIPDFTGM